MVNLKNQDLFHHLHTNMRYIKTLLFLVLLFAGLISKAQNDFITLGESVFGVNHDISDTYSINFTARSRYFLYRDANIQYKQQQVDIFHFSTLKLNYNHALSFGVFYRNRDVFESGKNEIRFTQQFNYKIQKLGVRYGHRFRTEQRIIDTRTIFRQRYRFAIDFPLNGQKLDIGEAYFVGALESLLSLSKTSTPAIDQRVTFQIGWQLTEDLKLQTGLEYRLEAYNIKANHSLFVLTSAILKI